MPNLVQYPHDKWTIHQNKTGDDYSAATYSPSTEAVQYADYILNHYSRYSHADKLCLAIDLEKRGWKNDNSNIPLKITMNMTKQLSESLLAACKAAGIEKPICIVQGHSGAVYHTPYISKPTDAFNGIGIMKLTRINHPPYATNWQDSLLEWVEPCVNYIEDKSICDSSGEPKGQCLNCGAKDYEHEQGESLADVLARHPESFTIETERNDDNEVTAHFIRDHHGDITEMIRPEHVADTSKMIPSGIEAMVCDDIAKRQQVGIAKYGTTVAENPLTHAEWLQHAYEECLDMAVYLKRAMAELQTTSGKIEIENEDY
jgi:hypothetical protein